MAHDMTISRATHGEQIAKWNSACKRDLFWKITILALVLFASIGALAYNAAQVYNSIARRAASIPAYAFFLTPILIGIMGHVNRKKDAQLLKTVKDADDMGKYSSNPVLAIGSFLSWVLFAPFAFLNQRFDRRAFCNDDIRFDTSDKLRDKRVTFESLAYGYGRRCSIMGHFNDWDTLLSYGFIQEENVEINGTPIREWLIYKTEVVMAARKRLRELEALNSDIADRAEKAPPYDENSSAKRTPPQEYLYQLSKIERVNKEWDENRERVCYKFVGGEGRPLNLMERWLLDTEEVVTIPEDKPSKEKVKKPEDDDFRERFVIV